MIKLMVSLVVLLGFSNCSLPREYRQEFIILDPDSLNISGGFKPSEYEIEITIAKFFQYLDSNTASGHSRMIGALDGPVPVEDQLRYYKRRYSGVSDSSGDRIIKTEFVHVRCGGNSDWKRVEYTTDTSNACWWEVQYNMTKDSILNLRIPGKVSGS